VTTVIIILSLVVIMPSPVRADQSTAATAISSAKTALIDCYNSAKQAEAAGANITSIVGTLNQAGSLLGQAELAYAASDFDKALGLAVQSQNTLDNFISEAEILEETATQKRNQDFLINVVGSIAGTFAVIVGGFVAWLFLKRKYSTVGARKSESSRV
jgi:hypothetical protein